MSFDLEGQVAQWAAEVEVRHKSRRRRQMDAARDAMAAAAELPEGPERDEALARMLAAVAGSER